MNVMPLNLRQDDAYMSCSPFGMLTINDYARNMNTGALGTMFPFYNSEVNEPNGTFLGINVLRNTPIIVDLFNRKALGNANLFISGASGSGKSYLTSLIMMRSALEGVRHCIIDPENEYGACCNVLGGVTIRIAPNSDNMLNPYDIDEEVETDDNGTPTGRRFVDIKGKCSELLNLFGVMFPGMIDAEVKSEISDVLMIMYRDFGFTEKTDSLYESGTMFNPETGEYYRDKILKKMPKMSDFRDCLSKRAEERDSEKLRMVVNSLNMYCGEGVYNIFDCYSTVNMSSLENIPVIRFDVQGIEDDILRPIGMQIALSWAWNKFMKKDAKTKKRIVCDEAWMLLAQSMAGSEYTAHFLENCARRVRKYNGSLCCASQNFREFVGRPEGQAILTNSAVRIFLKQQPEDIQAVGDRFILSDGEKRFLLSANRGDTLMKVGNESVIASVFAFPFEHQLISKEHLEAS
jgi:type IV secretory pathway VirB4 component